MRTIPKPAWILSLSMIISCLVFSTAPSLAQDDSKDEKVRTMVYPLSHLQADEAYRVLRELMLNEMAVPPGERQFNIVPDPRGNRLIIQGRDRQHERVLTILQMLDRDQPKQDAAPQGKNVEVEVLWIADVNDGESSITSELLSDVPEELSDLVKNKLADRLNLENPKLVTKLMVQTMVAGKDAGRIQAEHVGRGGEKQLMLSAIGQIAATDSEKYGVVLTLQIGTDMSKSSIDTTFLINPGKPLCLAVAETGPLNSVFIVRVREGDND